MNTYDLICIGCGPAGEKAASQAAYFRKSVAIVEACPRPGGAMINTGTIPSKVLRETALILSALRRHSIPGVDFQPPQNLSIRAFMARMFATQQLEHDRIESSIDRHGVSIHAGRAEFLDPHTLFVTPPNGPAFRVEAENILIATGSRPADPVDLGFGHPRIVNSNELLAVNRIPKSLIILGGGVIATEYACIFAQLGVAVTMIEPRADILSFLDPDIRAQLRLAMEDAGITVLTDAVVSGFDPPHREDDKTSITVELESGRTLKADFILYATGRTGCTDQLGLEKVNIEPNQRGYLKVNDFYQTSQPSIYAAGDVIGFPALASTSMEQGRIAACHMFNIDYKKSLAPVLPIGLYTIPAIATVGLSQEEAVKQGFDVMVGQSALDFTARGRILHSDEGSASSLVKIVFEYPSRRLIGVQMIGPEATELIHIPLMALRSTTDLTQNDTIDRFVHAVFNYPSLSEALRLAAIDGLQAIARRENRTDQLAVEPQPEHKAA